MVWNKARSERNRFLKKMKETKFPKFSNSNSYQKVDPHLPIILEENEIESDEVEKISYSTRRTKIVFVIFNFINFLIGVGYSMQAPFFPKEAEKKHVSSSIYGFIFGIFQMMNFFLSPIYGKYIREIGAKFLLTAGSYIMAISFVIFGFLDKADAGTQFIVLSFSVRITEAVGNSAFTTACYSIAAQEFSADISGTFAYLQASFATGMIVGPTFGGYLYELGGFPLPFFVAGSLMLSAAMFTTCVLPPIEINEQSKRNILQLLRKPGIIISCFSLFSVAFSFGFVGSILEPHVRQYGLRPSVLGCVFIIDGVVCALTNRLWGLLADVGVNLKFLCSCGSCLLAAAFFLLGPAPFLPVEPQLWLTTVALALYGLGIGGEFLIPFLDIIQEAIRNGYPDNIETYGLSSGLWSSSAALGEFIGPSVAGVLNDVVGFRSATMVVTGLHLIVIISNLGYFLQEKFSSHKTVKNSPSIPEIVISVDK